MTTTYGSIPPRTTAFKGKLLKRGMPKPLLRKRKKK